MEAAPERPDVVRRLVPQPAGGGIVSTASAERGRGPPPGVLHAPFAWPDVLDGPPPRRSARGEGAYSFFHGLEVDPDTRITYCTVVSVDPGLSPDPADDVIHLDSVVGVQHRLFRELIHRERHFVGRLTSRWRERLVERIVKQRRWARRLRYAWMRRAALAVVRAEGRVGHWFLRRLRGASMGAVRAPDAVYSSWERARWHLYDRLGRRGLWEGLKDPRSLTGQQKSVVLFLSISVIVSVVLALNVAIPFVAPASAGAYRDVVSAFFFGVATAVLLPFPPSELLVIPPYLSSGPPIAFLTLVTSKVAGAWMVFFIGDALHTLIEQQTEGRPRLARVVQWMNRSSRRYGFYILAAFMTMPFLPDTLALYVFAVSGMTFRAYLAAAGVGSVLRYGAVVGIMMYYGEARVREMFG